MRLNKKILAVTAILAVGILAGCSSAASSNGTASSVASSVASSAAASSVPEEQSGDILPIDAGTLDDIKDPANNYIFAANITAVKDGQMTMTVYSYDAYEKADIDALEVGDVIQTHDQGDTTVTKLEVKSIERDEDAGSVTINGGIEEGGLELWIDHDVYRTVTMDDYPVYYAMGELTLPMQEDVSISDTSADVQVDSAAVSEGIKDVEAAFDADPDDWTANNTTVFTDGGKVSGVNRVWVP